MLLVLDRPQHQLLCLPSAVALNANRHVSGVLRGFDQFMNIVLDNAVDEKNKTDIGMVVSCLHSARPGSSCTTLTCMLHQLRKES